MTARTFEKTLRELKWREPFRPFRIRLTDGRVLTVHERLAFGFVGRFGGLIDRRGRRHRFDAGMVAEIEAPPSRSRPLRSRR